MQGRSPLRGVVILSTLALALGLLAAARLPVALDEAYYWTWSRRLGWSYFDHPPGIAFALAAARALFGEGLLALRVVSVGCTLLTVGFVRASAREAAHPEDRLRSGRLAVLLCLAALMLVVGYLPATPDPLQGVVLSAAAWALGRGLRGARWAGGLAGFLLVAGVLAKHSSALIAAGALVGALSLPAGRRALRWPQTWLGIVLGTLCLLPWLYADLGAMDGATGFQAARVVSGRSPRGLLAVPLTLGALALTVGPAAAVGVFGGLLDARPKTRVWSFGAGALVLGCVVAAWLGAGELNWLMPAFAFGAPAAVGFVGRQRGPRGKALIGLSALGAAFNLVVLLHIVYPFAPIPPRKDRTLRAAGFEDVAQVVKEQAERYGARALVTRGYQAASQLRFQLEDRWPVLETGSGRRSQYDRWPRPAACEGDVVVLAWGRRDLPPKLEATAIAPTRTATRARAGRTLDPYFVHTLRVTGHALCDGEGE